MPWYCMTTLSYRRAAFSSELRVPKYFFSLSTITRIYHELPFLEIPRNREPLKNYWELWARILPGTTCGPLCCFFAAVIMTSRRRLPRRESANTFLFLYMTIENFFSTAGSRIIFESLSFTPGSSDELLGDILLASSDCDPSASSETGWN